VFAGNDTNKQKIIRRDYPLYKVGTIVLKRPTRKPSGQDSELPIKLFNFDPRLFIIIEKLGRKYILEN
jgi:hypothetical protein